MIWCLSEEGGFGVRCVHRRTPCEDEGRTQGDASTHLGTPQTASKPPEARMRQGRESSSQASETCPHSDLGFLVLRTVRQYILMFSATQFVVCSNSSPRKVLELLTWSHPWTKGRTHSDFLHTAQLWLGSRETGCWHPRNMARTGHRKYFPEPTWQLHQKVKGQASFKPDPLLSASKLQKHS